MKKIIIMICGVLLYTTSTSQCTTSGFDVCSDPSPFVTNFVNPVQVTGTGLPLSIGAKYKFDNVNPGIDAIVSIDKMQNAVMKGTYVESPNIDDDNSMNETGVPGSQSALFAPRISPDVELKCSDRTGYVQFTVRFFLHTSGNAMPSALLAVPLTNPNFLHFDMDGHTVGNNGWFREIGYVQQLNTLPVNPVNFGSINTLLQNGTPVLDAQGTWIRTNGAKEERDNLSRCAQVIEKSTYVGLFTAVSFRFGYEYKAPSNCVSFYEGRPTRQYGSKFGCFTLPSAAALPVNLTDLKVNYNKGVAVLNWNTNQEINIEKYIVERSLNGTDFTDIGSVNANNFSGIHKYQYSDTELPSASEIFYRVRIKENNNIIKVTNIVSVKIKDEGLNMVVSPNPASTIVQLRFAVSKNSKIVITVLDASGKLILSQPAEARTGNNVISLNNISGLTDGIYIVKMVTDTKHYSSKLIIRR